MFNLLVSILAFAMLAVGIVLLVSPIPFGFAIIALSVSVLVCVNLTVRGWIKKLRARYDWMNRKVHRLESLLEHKFVRLWRAVSHTRPDDNDV